MSQPGPTETVLWQGIPAATVPARLRRLVNRRRLIRPKDQDGRGAIVEWVDGDARTRWALPDSSTGEETIPTVSAVLRITVPNAYSDMHNAENIHVIFAGPRGQLLANVTTGEMRSHKCADVAYPLTSFESLLGLGIDVIEERIETFTDFHTRHPNQTTNPIALAIRRLYFRLL